MSRSGGLSDSMNQRAMSAPYLSMIAPGSTTFFFDLLIASDRPTVTGSPPEARRIRPSSPSATSSG